jgi:hypothetical protein
VQLGGLLLLLHRLTAETSRHGFREQEKASHPMPEATFQKALGALTDESYRKSLEGNPGKLLKDFDLTPGEQIILLAVGEKTGAVPDVEGYLSSPTVACCSCCCCI